MSDPAYDGYTCHGPMRLVSLSELSGQQSEDKGAVFVCDACGVWRHARPRSDATVRAWVEQRMPSYLQQRGIR